jgi:uncharacterized protein YjfI (DUF2170 family)
MSETPTAPPPAPKRRIRRKGGSEEARNLRMYFNEKTQAAIVAYQKSDVREEKHKLYVTEILPAFQKLVENLINIHKFTDIYDSFDDLKSDCVNFLFETLPKYDPTRGTLAFSYFNVVAKNWLIIRTKQKSVRIKRYVSMDDQETLSQGDMEAIESYQHLPSQDTTIENDQQKAKVMKTLYDIQKMVKNENERVCIESIIHVFENVNQLDFFNKNAIMLYIRELSGLSSKQLTSTLQVMKKNYKLLILTDD